MIIEQTVQLMSAEGEKRGTADDWRQAYATGNTVLHFEGYPDCRVSVCVPHFRVSSLFTDVGLFKLTIAPDTTQALAEIDKVAAEYKLALKKCNDLTKRMAELQAFVRECGK